MKRLFSILVALSFSIGLAADGGPTFEEADENESVFAYLAPFSANEPSLDEVVQGEPGKPYPFNQDQLSRCTKGIHHCNPPKACDDCDEGHCNEHGKGSRESRLTPEEENRIKATYMSWKRYKVNFGMEKIFMRFPFTPTISQSSTLLTAYAYDHGNMYSFTGYYPPIGNIESLAWFDELLFSISQFPFTCLSHVFYQSSSGDWVMDYVAHDYVQNVIIKTRAIVTPFNAYTLQCVKPNGARDHFDYFLDSFWVKCDCAQ